MADRTEELSDHRQAYDTHGPNDYPTRLARRVFVDAVKVSRCVICTVAAESAETQGAAAALTVHHLKWRQFAGPRRSDDLLGIARGPACSIAT